MTDLGESQRGLGFRDARIVGETVEKNLLDDVEREWISAKRVPGMKVQKPIPSRTALPFNEIPGVFESFLMSWNFLVVYGYVVSTWQPCCILIFSQASFTSRSSVG